MRSIVLIGMPGAGKSTVGVLLAKRLALGFIDTDLLIQEIEGKALQDIVDGEGYEVLRDVEEKVLCALEARHAVIATGGSAVYSERAMAHLRQLGDLVYLQLPLAGILARVRNLETRGLARRPGQTLEDLFHERALLYERHAQVSLNCEGLSAEETVDAICDALKV